MTQPSLTLAARLGLDRYEIDAARAHIEVDPARCELCTVLPCLTVCPAHVYERIDERLVVRYENCLECGTCQIACKSAGQGGITWRNPLDGSGIRFRYG